MGAAIVGVVGTLLGASIGIAWQYMDAKRKRKWQQEDALNDAKRAVFAEYLRSISGGYAQAMAGQRSASEEANLRASTTAIAILATSRVSGYAADLTEAVIATHKRIAEGAGVPTEVVSEVDHRRQELIKRFRAELRTTDSRPTGAV